VREALGRRRWLAPAALAVVVGLAAALRLVGIRYGLPLPLLNPDEANIVPRAWAIGHADRADPAFYDYPSLLFYVLAPFQALAAEPSYVTARVIGVAIGLVGVVAAWLLGRRAYGTPAAVVGAAAVAVATTHVAYSRMAVTDVLLTTLVTAALWLAVARRLEWAGLAVGLAASAKYPGVLAVAPLVVAGWGSWSRLARALALAALAFVLTSPFVLIHAGAARDDLSRVQRLARDGWLGFEDDPPSLLGFADRLWHGLGPVLALTVVGVALAARRRSRADLVLGAFVVAYGVYLAPLGAHFDRYVLPLVPVAGVLAGRVGRLAPLAVALLVVPLWWSIGDARDLTRTDARVAMARWIEAEIDPAATIALDPSTGLLSRNPVVRLELPGPGRPSDPRRDLAALRADGVQYVLVSGAVTDRVRAAAGRYPREMPFYGALEAQDGVALAHAVEPGRAGIGGPWARLYRIPR
jgi:4-amino-4-deoxy-L-arabinose transferase-like glycosyltransferase